jgi:hypothetical protein
MTAPELPIKWMTQEELDKHRRNWANIPKDHIREINTAKTTGLPTVDEAPLPVRKSKPVTNPEEPRRVADTIATMMVNAAHQSPEKANFYAELARRHNPDLFGGMTNEEIIPLLVNHASEQGRIRTEEVYRKNPGWHKGTNVGGGGDLDATLTGIVTPAGFWVDNKREKVTVGDTGSPDD